MPSFSVLSAVSAVSAVAPALSAQHSRHARRVSFCTHPSAGILFKNLFVVRFIDGPQNLKLPSSFSSHFFDTSFFRPLATWPDRTWHSTLRSWPWKRFRDSETPATDRYASKMCSEYVTPLCFSLKHETIQVKNDLRHRIQTLRSNIIRNKKCAVCYFFLYFYTAIADVLPSYVRNKYLPTIFAVRTRYKIILS